MTDVSHSLAPEPATRAATTERPLVEGLRIAPYGRQGLPLIVRPADDGRAPRLDELVRREGGRVRHWLRDHGAVLFRGFAVQGSEAFESTARAFAPELGHEYLGTSPRASLGGRVFSASELPGHFPIPQHLEMSFLATPPRWLFFHAPTPNRGPGGETPLADFRAVWRDLDPALRERFRERGVRNVRRYAGPKHGRSFDPWQLKRWDEMFGTTDRAEVEAKARAQGLEPSWSADGTLTLANTQRAFRRHPETGELVWSNHVQVFHPSAAAGELGRVARRRRSVRVAGTALLASVLTALRRRLAPEGLPMDVTYGDGTRITDEEAAQVRDAIWKNLVVFRWQRDDVLFVDNAIVSHGRFPYSGPRKVAVAWA